MAQMKKDFQRVLNDDAGQMSHRPPISASLHHLHLTPPRHQNSKTPSHMRTSLSSKHMPGMPLPTHPTGIYDHPTDCAIPLAFMITPQTAHSYPDRPCRWTGPCEAVRPTLWQVQGAHACSHDVPCFCQSFLLFVFLLFLFLLLVGRSDAFCRSLSRSSLPLPLALQCPSSPTSLHIFTLRSSAGRTTESTDSFASMALVCDAICANCTST
jgi:hypothetical protein